MRFATAIALTGSLALVLVGCKEEAAPSGAAPATPQSAQDLANQAGDAWTQARDAAVAQVETRVEALETRVAELRAQAETAEATEAMKTLATEAGEALDAAKASLQRLAESGASEWESLRDSLATALDDLEAKVRPAG